MPHSSSNSSQLSPHKQGGTLFPRKGVEALTVLKIQSSFYQGFKVHSGATMENGEWGGQAVKHNVFQRLLQQSHPVTCKSRPYAYFNLEC